MAESGASEPSPVFCAGWDRLAESLDESGASEPSPCCAGWDRLAEGLAESGGLRGLV